MSNASEPERQAEQGWNQALPLRELMAFFLPRLRKDDSPPIWPPDMFALAMGVIARWGLHARALEDWPPGATSSMKWHEEVKAIGATWRNHWTSHPPEGSLWWQTHAHLQEIETRWKRIVAMSDHTAASFSQPGGAADAAIILEMASIADEACIGMGTAFEQLAKTSQPQDSSGGPYTPEVKEFYFRAELRLILTVPEGSTLCEEIVPSRIRVLPKMHTPASGLTVRSLSHNLAVLETCEIKPEWWIPDKLEGGDYLNLLFIPVPRKVAPVDFKAVFNDGAAEMRNMHKEHFGFFKYAPEQGMGNFDHELRALVLAAETNVGRVHGILMPELAVTEKEFAKLTRTFFELPVATPKPEQEWNRDSAGRGARAFVIGGVRSSEAVLGGQSRGTNQVSFAYGRRDDDRDSPTDNRQSKHHRWKLDASQIKQYGLGGRLDPVRDWWEHIGICNRSLMFLSLQPWLVISTLICEDLARPDPVGDLIRAVGPNLVIALLMDGPQVKERWSARYATTLADDPGSSVLSITSLGMSSLSRPRSGTPSRSRVIALWKDAKAGSITEIELPHGADAIVLTLTRRYSVEWTADGRKSEGGGYPELSGVHPINQAGIV